MQTVCGVLSALAGLRTLRDLQYSETSSVTPLFAVDDSPKGIPDYFRRFTISEWRRDCYKRAHDLGRGQLASSLVEDVMGKCSKRSVTKATKVGNGQSKFQS